MYFHFIWTMIPNVNSGKVLYANNAYDESLSHTIITITALMNVYDSRSQQCATFPIVIHKPYHRKHYTHWASVYDTSCHTYALTPRGRMTILSSILSLLCHLCRGLALIGEILGKFVLLRWHACGNCRINRQCLPELYDLFIGLLPKIRWINFTRS
jgi:hypothetical protein